jgi:hypothetical protein
MIDLNVNKFYLVKGVPLRCLFIFKMSKTIIFKSEKIFLFRVDFEFCDIILGFFKGIYEFIMLGCFK